MASPIPSPTPLQDRMVEHVRSDPGHETQHYVDAAIAAGDSRLNIACEFALLNAKSQGRLKTADHVFGGDPLYRTSTMPVEIWTVNDDRDSDDTAATD